MAHKFSCYDCGSTIKGHHTPSCDMAGKRDKRDLPEKPGTQWWTREVPAHLIEAEDVEGNVDPGSAPHD